MKKALIIFSLTAILGLCGIYMIFKSSPLPRPDIINVNDAVMSGVNIAEMLKQEYERVNEEIQNRDSRLFLLLCVYSIIIAIVGIIIYYFREASILRPFKKLQGFAHHIAAGNFEVPLEMDKKNLFGAFTESFDLMREELHRAKENERKIEQSKKELVASLSHDIKTPVASIKAVTELMLFMAKEEEDKRQLEIISEKAEQINVLITNMFHATLEELQALTVSIDEIQSTAIPNLIMAADYEQRIKPFTIPSCIVLCDLLRLQQVFDNIIGNSYKYAGTDMEVKSFFEGQYLVIDIIDFGAGVSEDELPLLHTKFYRGKNTDTKSGYGLGLYISDYLMKQMSGNLRLENRPDGFTVSLMLRLAR